MGTKACEFLAHLSYLCPYLPCGATALGSVITAAVKASPEAGPVILTTSAPWPSEVIWPFRPGILTQDHGMELYAALQHQLGPKPLLFRTKQATETHPIPGSLIEEENNGTNKILRVRWEDGKTRIEILKEFHIKN